MRKQASMLDWIIAEDDVDWAHQSGLFQPDSELTINRRPFLNSYFWSIVAPFLLADKLIVSKRTVNAHATSIYSKLGVTSRALVTRVAVEQNLV